MIEGVLLSLELARIFISARTAMNKFDFENGKSLSDKFITVCEQILALDRNFIHYTAQSYWNRFWKPSFDEAYRAIQQGEVIFKFPDQWNAFLDPTGIGEMMELYRPDISTKNWLKLKTYSASLADQGYYGYRGRIRYRATFKLPAKKKSAQIFLLFCGVDGYTKVWVNGREIGEYSTHGFGPGKFEITDQIRSGSLNCLVVETANNYKDYITELGTGGIAKPLFMYTTEK